MTAPIGTPTPFERFTAMIDHLIHGKTQPKPTVKPEDEEPSWALNSRQTIQSSGKTLSDFRYQR